MKLMQLKPWRILQMRHLYWTYAKPKKTVSIVIEGVAIFEVQQNETYNWIIGSLFAGGGCHKSLNSIELTRNFLGPQWQSRRMNLIRLKPVADFPSASFVLNWMENLYVHRLKVDERSYAIEAGCGRQMRQLNLVASKISRSTFASSTTSANAITAVKAGAGFPNCVNCIELARKFLWPQWHGRWMKPM